MFPNDNLNEISNPVFQDKEKKNIYMYLLTNTLSFTKHFCKRRIMVKNRLFVRISIIADFFFFFFILEIDVNQYSIQEPVT